MRGLLIPRFLDDKAVSGMDEASAIAELLAAHAEMERSTAALADARERRREAARQLIELGHGTSWIAKQLGVSRQAVDGFLKYKDRHPRS
jgi:ATP-dependent Clp protease ATP-binding subunit ClpA